MCSATYTKALAHNPLAPEARQNAAALLFLLGKGDEAVAFFQDQIARFGELPTLLFGYGRALLEAGRANEAVQPLFTATQQSPEVSAFRECYERAMAAATRPTVSSPARRRDEHVSRSDWEGCLADFAEHVRTTKRMTFWRNDGGRHKWTASPEQLAKDLLHTFVKGRFGPLVEGVEELNSGAGRIDLMFTFAGGLRVVTELKMCGAPSYSASSAEDGIDQLVHYMDNKECSLGYLLVFDGRRRDFGEGFPTVLTSGRHTVFTRCIDVRPEIEAAQRDAG